MHGALIISGTSEYLIPGSIRQLAFAYSTIGSNLPTAEEVAKEVFQTPMINVDLQNLNRPLSFLAEISGRTCIPSEPLRLSDLEILPLVATAKPLPIITWQWFRSFHSIFMLMPELMGDCKIQIESNEWSYLRSGNRIACSMDWLSGLSERNPRFDEIPHGSYIKINREYLDTYLSNNNMRLGYISHTVIRNIIHLLYLINKILF